TLCCEDCFGLVLLCRTCILACHSVQLLHWNGAHFVRTSLRKLSLKLQLGHSPGELCPSPAAKTCHLVRHPRVTPAIPYCHLSGIHEVEIRFCKCIDATSHCTAEWTQLLRAGWFPATTRVPTTIFSFDLLKMFQGFNFQVKVNLHNFWKTIEWFTDNSGGSDNDCSIRIYNHYKQFSHVMQLWRHFVQLKHFTRAHDPTGTVGTAHGELIIECATCPHLDKNLPADWSAVPPHLKYVNDTRTLYALLISISLDGYIRSSS
ncbi:hypothetical protein LXA43DRAFT_887288, partial [Ganoderma leucocontextum]